MIVDIKDKNTPEHAWHELKKFQNIAYTRQLIMRKHNLSEKDKKNAERQAKSIRYCLIQAEEYYQSSLATTIATQPLLMYYSLMSLALAQILFSGTGDHRLEKLRATDGHHGLSFHVNASISCDDSLLESSKKLCATPAIDNKRPYGTFNVWHSFSREYPVFGENEIIYTTNSVKHIGPILIPSEEFCYERVPHKGLTYFDIISSMPALGNFLRNNNIYANIIRGNISLKQRESENFNEIIIIIHPDEELNLERFYNLIKIHPRQIPCINVTEFNSGLAISNKVYFLNQRTNIPSFILPPHIQYKTGEIYFPTKKPILNEFGQYYAALFIIGNYCRYYPDFWMQDVEKVSPLALSAIEVLKLAKLRAPLAMLNILDENFHISFT